MFDREKIEETLKLADKIGGEIVVCLSSSERRNEHWFDVYGHDAVDRVLRVTDRIKRTSSCGSCYVDGQAMAGDVEIRIPTMCKREDIKLADIVKEVKSES